MNRYLIGQYIYEGSKPLSEYKQSGVFVVRKIMIDHQYQNGGIITGKTVVLYRSCYSHIFILINLNMDLYLKKADGYYLYECIYKAILDNLNNNKKNHTYHLYTVAVYSSMVRLIIYID